MSTEHGLTDCVLCKAEAVITSKTEEFIAANPLADCFDIQCSPGCPNGGWSGRNASRMIEEWNETQRVMSAAEDTHGNAS